MGSTTITLALEGEVLLDPFAHVTGHFHGLVAGLSSELAQEADIAWVMEDLEVIGAMTTIRWESAHLAAVERVVRAYDVVGKSLERSQPIPYSERVAIEARGILAVLNGKITAIRFETANEDSIVTSAPSGAPQRLVTSFGAIKGRIQSRTGRTSLRFTLFDSVSNRGVSCYLQEGREELMDSDWDQRAIVEGWVSRDPITGRPIAIRQVSQVTLLKDVKPGSFRAARGVVSIGGDRLLPEDAIRRLRDG